MRIVVLVLLLLGAQFAFTAFAPTAGGKAWILWPFAADSKPRLGFLGGLPRQGGSVVTPFLAGAAGLCFLAAALAPFGLIVPASWFSALVLGGAFSSGLLFALYFGVWAVAPIVIDFILVWGVLMQNWAATYLQGS